MKIPFILTAYLIYLPVVILLTWYVARTLFNSGKIFMLDIFHGREDISSSTNKLFEVGFYLLNLGFALLILEINRTLSSNQSIIEVLSVKVGGYSIYLGVMLFFNMYLFFRGRKKSHERQRLAVLLQNQSGSATGAAE
jgi:hypothetical protein